MQLNLIDISLLQGASACPNPTRQPWEPGRMVRVWGKRARSGPRSTRKVCRLYLTSVEIYFPFTHCPKNNSPS